MAKHPNKDIRAALDVAVSNGWTVKKSGPRAHAWGTIKCGFGHRACWMAIYSTPRNPRNHAKQIERKVAACPAADNQEEVQNERISVQGGDEPSDQE